MPLPRRRGSSQALLVHPLREEVEGALRLGVGHLRQRGDHSAQHGGSGHVTQLGLVSGISVMRQGECGTKGAYHVPCASHRGKGQPLVLHRPAANLRSGGTAR